MHKLLKSEINDLDNYWKFIELFLINIPTKYPIDSPYDFRQIIIKKIRENYSAEDFYKFEKILNKLLWNLIEHIDFDINNIIVHDNYLKLYDKINRSKRSFSHKLYLHDEKNNREYFFKYYQKLNDYDKIKKIFTVLTNRKLYEKVMKNKKYIYNIKFVQYYYPLDYPFPNINLIFYNDNKKETWLERINKLYFNGKNNVKDINNGWYEFIF